MALSVLPLGDGGDHGLDVVRFGSRQSEPINEVVDELLRVVDLLFLVIEGGAGASGAEADKGALWAGDAAEVSFKAVKFLKETTGLADQVAGDIVAD